MVCLTMETFKTYMNEMKDLEKKSWIEQKAIEIFSLYEKNELPAGGGLMWLLMDVKERDPRVYEFTEKEKEIVEELTGKMRDCLQFQIRTIAKEKGIEIYAKYADDMDGSIFYFICKKFTKDGSD